MKEAIGTSFVFNLVITFTAIFIVLYVGSIAYSKGFKIRNRIIDIIEANGGYNETAALEIDENLSTIGYQITNRACPDRSDKGANTVDITSAYNYCLYSYTDALKGDYYGVTVFIKFNIPIIGNVFEIPLYGETRLLFEKGKVTG